MEQTTTRKTSRFSKLKVGLAAVALGALLVVPSASADDQAVTFDVAGTPLSQALTQNTAMSEVTYSTEAAGTSIGQLNASVTDERGTETGWTASVAVADFTNLGETIAADEFTLTGNDTIVVTNGATATDLTLKGTSTAIAFTAPATAVAIASAAEADGTNGGGIGTFDWTIDTALNVPAAQKEGSYSSTVTLTTADTPTTL